MRHTALHAAVQHVWPALSLLLAASLPAMAQVPEPEALAASAPESRLERVEVSGVRSSFMPYQSWVEAAAPIHALSHGLLRFGVRLYSRDSSRPLKVTVQDEGTRVAVAPLVGQLYVVPHDLAVQGPEADVSVNRAEGQWGAGSFALVPQLEAQNAQMANVRQVLKAYQEVYSKRFPLKWRLLTRSEASFDVCTDREGQHLKAVNADGTEVGTLPLNRQVKDHSRTTGRTLHCASITSDAPWGDQVRLAWPDAAVTLLGFRLI